MPIPQLTTKNKSQQTWRKKSYSKKRPNRSRLPKKPVYTGGKKSSGRKKLPANIIKIILTLAVFGIAFGGIIGIFMIAWVAKDLPNPDKIIDRSIALSTKIYDRTGENLLYDVHGAEKRTFISLPDVPEHLKNATLTAEDREFYKHGGISITGIIRSVIKNITTGSRVGGSTLTQQLVKNAILSPEKTYTRKIKEIILSYQIEKKFSKDEILQMYFNEIPYGSVAYGSQAAVQTYFGKNVEEISLAEAAIIAALPQAPTYYSPYGSHIDALLVRQHWILDSMAELGYITEEEARFAKDEKLEFKKRSENIVAPHFVMYVREYLTKEYGELTVEQGGLEVITTLDLYKQEIAEEVVTEIAETNQENYEASNAALVALDTKTGQILAMVGSKDYFADPYPEDCAPGRDCTFDPQVNATLRLRQPGSSFKPIVYTAAFKKGYTSNTVLYDVVTKFKNYDSKDYEPKNYDLEEHGPVTTRKALQGSLNIPAVKTIYLTGVDNVIDLAQDLGYTSLDDRSRFGLSLVLGGGEVKLIEHVGAFGTLAREGEWHPQVAIMEVKDKDGNVLEKYQEKEKKVLSTQIARQINNVLSDNTARAYIFGENNYLSLGGRPVCAKTGTTNDYRDAWTVGYTPSIAVGVWVGNNNNKEMKRGAAGGVVAAPIWNKFMNKILGDTAWENFREPDEEDIEKPVLNGSSAEGIKVKIDKMSGKLATNLTPEHLVEEKTFKDAHSILHYINKDDPQGSSGPDLDSDQYQRWEEAIQIWAEANEYVIEQPPTEFDEIHTLANKPDIDITSPNSGKEIDSRELKVSVNASAPRGVRRVEYYLNNQLLKTITNSPYSLDVFVEDPNIGRGSYILKATVFDDYDNNNSDQINLNFQVDPLPTAVSWTSPTNNQSISQGDFPYTIKASLGNPSSISQITLFHKGSDNTENYINLIRQFPGDQLVSQWQSAPEPGTYTLYAEITNKAGYSYKSEEVTVNIE